MERGCRYNLLHRLPRRAIYSDIIVKYRGLSAELGLSTSFKTVSPELAVRYTRTSCSARFLLLRLGGLIFFQVVVEVFGVQKLLQLRNFPVRVEPNQVDIIQFKRLPWKERTSSASPTLKDEEDDSVSLTV